MCVWGSDWGGGGGKGGASELKKGEIIRHSALLTTIAQLPILTQKNCNNCLLSAPHLKPTLLIKRALLLILQAALGVTIPISNVICNVFCLVYAFIMKSAKRNGEQRRADSKGLVKRVHQHNLNPVWTVFAVIRSYIFDRFTQVDPSLRQAFII